MKLPEFQTTPVQSVGGIEEARSSIVHMGNEQARAWGAGAGLASTIGDWGYEMARGVSQVEHAQALTDLALADAKAKRENAAKTLWTTKEVQDLYGGDVPEEVKNRIPGGLSKRGVDPDNPDDTTEVDRTDIPAWAVNPERYKKTMDAAVQSASQRITLPGFRQEFVNAAQKQVGIEFEQHKAEAQKEFFQWKDASMSLLVLRLAGEGQTDAAHGLVNIMDTRNEAERVKLHNEIDISGAKYAINKPMLEQDIIGMQNIGEALKSGETRFAYTNGKGETLSVDLSSLPEQTRRGLGLQMQREVRMLGNLNREEVERDRKDFNDKLTYSFVGMYDKKDWAGMRNFLSNPPAGTTGAERLKLQNLFDAWQKSDSKPDPEAKNRSTLMSETVDAAFQEAAQGQEPSVVNPYHPEDGPIDVRKMDILKFAEQNPQIPRATISKFIKLQNKLNSGEPLNVSRADINAASSLAVSLLGFKSDDPNIKQKEASAIAKSAFQSALQQELKKKPAMSAAEMTEFARSWAAQGQKQTGMLWWKNTVNAPALADVPTQYVFPLQAAISKYENLGYGNTAADYKRLYDERLKPMMDTVSDVWRETKEGDKPLKAPQLVGLAAGIDLNKEQIQTDYFNAYKRKPTDREVVQYYFQLKNQLKKAPRGG